MRRCLPLLSVLAGACVVAAEAPPTFAEVDDAVFSKGCAFSSCHGGGSGYLFLTGDLDGDYAALVDATSAGDPSEIRVIPGDAEGSYLVHKLEGRADIVGDPMPAGGTSLDPDLIALVRAWIDGGALR